MDDKLIKWLKESDDFISGEEISKRLGITRASVWKHIKNLKDLGYEIEGVSRKGYKLISSPDIIIPDEVLQGLNTKFIGREIKHFQEIDSTNKFAKTLDGSAPDGTVIVAEKQTGGKGRLGRVWSSLKGGLYFTLFLTPKIDPMKSSKLTQVAAAALVKVLRDKNINAEIKWPNDIYLNGKKLTGILTEMKCEIDCINYILIGIGINVNIDSSEFNDEVKENATSLFIEKGHKFNRTEILTSFLNIFENLYVDVIENDDFSDVVSLCRKYSMLIDKQAYWINGKNKVKVTCLGLNDNGELVVKTENGEEKSILSGEITFRA